MHEYSIMSQIVQTVILEVEKNRMEKVVKIVLEVGKLSFLGEEALRFCFQTLTKDSILDDSELDIRIIDPEVQCQSCGFNGDLEYLDSEDMHFRLPKFTCPKCNGPVKVIKGRDCVIREITGEVEDTVDLDDLDDKNDK